LEDFQYGGFYLDLDFDLAKLMKFDIIIIIIIIIIIRIRIISLIKDIDKTQPYNRGELVNVFKKHSIDIVSVIGLHS